MKAYIFLADGFEEVEALTTADLLIRAGVETKLVKVPEGSTGGCKAVRGSHNIKVKPDLTLGEDIAAKDLLDGDCVVRPGGMPGTKNLAASADVINTINAYNNAGKVVAAICAAPSVLGTNGLLKGKQATCFPGFENELKGANYTAAHVEIDEHVITAKGAGCSIEFGHAIVSFALDRAAADSVIEAMQCL